MQRVHRVFATLIGEEDEEEEHTVARHFHELWDMAHKPEVIEHIIEQDLGLSDAGEQIRTITQFKDDLAKRTIGPRGREVLNRLMPKVYQAVFAHPDAEFGLSRVLALL